MPVLRAALRSKTATVCSSQNQKEDQRMTLFPPLLILTLLFTEIGTEQHFPSSELPPEVTQALRCPTKVSPVLHGSLSLLSCSERHSSWDVVLKALACLQLEGYEWHVRTHRCHFTRVGGQWAPRGTDRCCDRTHLLPKERDPGFHLPSQRPGHTVDTQQIFDG